MIYDIAIGALIALTLRDVILYLAEYINAKINSKRSQLRIKRWLEELDDEDIWETRPVKKIAKKAPAKKRK